MHVEVSRNMGVAALAGCVALFGCKGKETAATTDTTSVAASTGAGDTSAAADAAMSDANIAALLDEANAGDSALGAAALPKLTSTGAKTFARMMMGEHHALHVEGHRAEKRQTVTPDLPTPEPSKADAQGEHNAWSRAAEGWEHD